MEDFILRALLGGVGVAIVTGPVGCFNRLAQDGPISGTRSHTRLSSAWRSGSHLVST